MLTPTLIFGCVNETVLSVAEQPEQTDVNVFGDTPSLADEEIAEGLTQSAPSPWSVGTIWTSPPDEPEVDEPAAEEPLRWGSDDPADPGIDHGSVAVAVFSPTSGELLDPIQLHFDDDHDTTSVPLTSGALDLTSLWEVLDEGQRFKVLLVNTGLNRGSRLVINADYSLEDPSTYMSGQDYGFMDPTLLPVLSSTGDDGSTKLEHLAIELDPDAATTWSLQSVSSECVEHDVRAGFGPVEPYRAGALTLQVVAVDDGGDAYLSEVAHPSTGAHGAAVEGLLYEVSVFLDNGHPCIE